jgi:hypothetical protein
MVRRFLLLAAVLGSLFAGLAAPLPAGAAYDPFAGACKGAATQSAACTSRTGEDPLTGPNGVLTKATNIIALVAGFAAVIFLVVGGIKYITAAGAPAEVQKAKETIIYALVGVIAIVLARQVISLVLSRV